MSSELLVGDIGGTNVRFARARRLDERIEIHGFSKRPSEAFDSFESAVQAYLADTGFEPSEALFALAGPVVNEQVELINRPDWPAVSSVSLCERFGLSRARLVNDFAAMARAIPELDAKVFEQILDQPRGDGPILVAGPGTGFGVATLVPNGERKWRVISAEGGHATFAAQTAEQHAVAERLQKIHGHVSNELVCSGRSFLVVYRIMCELMGAPFNAVTPAEVVRAASLGDELSIAFCKFRAGAIMGAAADYALTVGATGGVVLAGGVSRNLIPFIKQPEACEKFLNRGKRTNYMERISVSVLLDEAAPLTGAAALRFEE